MENKSKFLKLKMFEIFFLENNLTQNKLLLRKKFRKLMEILQ